MVDKSSVMICIVCSLQILLLNLLITICRTLCRIRKEMVKFVRALLTSEICLFGSETGIYKTFELYKMWRINNQDKLLRDFQVARKQLHLWNLARIVILGMICLQVTTNYSVFCSHQDLIFITSSGSVFVLSTLGTLDFKNIKIILLPLNLKA